jgi:hypothetical protein
MKKLSVRLSLLCLLAILVLPFAGCKKEEEGAEETPATTTDTTTTTSTSTETSMGTTTTTDMGMASDSGMSGTDSTMSPMTTDSAKPPAGK